MQMCQDSNGVSHVGALQYAGQRADHMHIKCVSSPLSRKSPRARGRGRRERGRGLSQLGAVCIVDDREIDPAKADSEAETRL